MRKHVLWITALTLAIGLSACSKKAEVSDTTAVETTTAETTTVAETSTETETSAEDEDIEEEYMTGTIVSFSDQEMKILSEDDQTEHSFDIKEAELIQKFPFSEGDLVEITFAAGSTGAVVSAIRVEVFESVIGENTDPMIEGTVEDAAMNTITIKTDEGSFTFRTTNAYMVAKDGILVNKKAQVSYLGDLDDTDPIPMAIKIVMEDSFGTAEAEINGFVGEVASIGAGEIVLSSDGEDYFSFVSSNMNFEEYQVGDLVQVTYTGSILDKQITATSIDKR